MLSSLIPITALLLSVVTGQTSGSTDPCSIGNKPVVSYSEAVACYKNFPLTDKVKNGVADTIRKSLPFYAFIDVSERSPEPKVPSYINIEREFNKLVAKNYSTEWEYQVAITKFFNRLEDGHTRYTSSCFSSFVFRQPFPIHTEEDKWGAVKVKVPSNLSYNQALLDAWKAAGVDVLSYAGAEVLSINGQQPLEYIEKYAKDYVGTSRDINSRINYALARTIQSGGKWGVSYGSFGATTITPVKETIDFTFRIDNKIKKVTVPYVASPSNAAGPFTTSKDFYNQNCVAPVAAADKSANKNHVQLLEVPEVKEIPIDAQIETNSRLEDPLQSAVVDGTFVKTYILENKVGVVHISTFSTPLGNQWFKEIKDGFKALKDQGVEKLVLDLSNNGGGYICWGYNVLDYLFPNATTKYFNTDMHYTPLLAKLTQKYEYDFFNPQDYNQPNGKPFDNDDAFTKPVTYRRGLNPKSQYTAQFQEKCSNNPLRELIPDGQQPFKTENIAVVSNSICYSTCTLLSNGMQEFHDVKSYAFGGLKYKPGTIGSLAGGTVYSLDGLLSSLQTAGLAKDPAAPQPFPTKSGLRFTVREAYSSRYKELRPLEFTWNPAKNHPAYNKDTSFNQYNVWTQVAKDL